MPFFRIYAKSQMEENFLLSPLINSCKVFISRMLVILFCCSRNNRKFYFLQHVVLLKVLKFYYFIIKSENFLFNNFNLISFRTILQHFLLCNRTIVVFQPKNILILLRQLQYKLQYQDEYECN